MKINSITFGKLFEKREAPLSMVILGAGGDASEWVTGIASMLRAEGIVKRGVRTFTEASLLAGNVKGDKGRRDLVLTFNPKAEVNVGKLAIWRIKFGDVSWVGDFIANHAADYANA